MPVKPRLFGKNAGEYAEKAMEVSAHPSTFYAALIDSSALWDPEVPESILKDFPAGGISEFDLGMILSECMSNATLHGRADALIFHARRRGSVIMLSFTQIPAMLGRVAVALAMARQGNLPDYATCSPSGLGFHILMRMAHRVTLSSDRHSLRIWMKIKEIDG